MLEKKFIFNKFFIFISLANFILLFGLFIFLEVKNYSIGVKSLSPENKYVFAGDNNDTPDPFITPGPAAQKIITQPIIDDRDPSIGSAAAELTIVEFSDFSCKFCAEQSKIVKDLVEKYAGRVRLIWKDFPDTKSLSYQSSLAARCAGEQGKFWEAHDLLFANGEKIFSKSLIDIANDLGIDGDKFKTCVLSEKFSADIKRNTDEAGALRLPGVPYFFVGDYEYLGEVDKNDIEMILEKK